MGFNCLKARFLPLSPQKFLVLTLYQPRKDERLSRESTLAPSRGFEQGTPGLGIQHLNR